MWTRCPRVFSLASSSFLSNMHSSSHRFCGPRRLFCPICNGGGQFFRRKNFRLLIMGWLGDLWSSVKQKATSIYDTAKETASNWLSGKYLAPGYSYCGPGNALNAGEPRNASDALCRQHDIDYSNFAKVKGKSSKEEMNALIRESDNRLVSGLQSLKDRDIGSHLAEYGIRAKKKLEDWGILSPDRFVVE